MKKHVAVIGLGRFGFSVAKTLAKYGSEVIAIDREEERVKKVSEFVSYAVQLDAMDEKALRSVGVQNVDTAIVSIGENIEASILVVMLLKEIGIRNIIAKAVTTLHGKVLENLGVQRIIFPERDMAIRVAHSLIRPNVLEQLELSRGIQHRRTSDAGPPDRENTQREPAQNQIWRKSHCHQKKGYDGKGNHQRGVERKSPPVGHHAGK